MTNRSHIFFAKYGSPSQTEDVYSKHKNNFETHLNLVRNKALSKKVVHSIATSDDPDRQASVAAHPHVSGKLLDDLTQSNYARTRVFSAKNPNLTEEQMLRLSNDSDEHVRDRLMNNPAITSKVVNHVYSREIDPDQSKSLHDPYLLTKAIKHPLLSDENISKTIAHPMTSYRIDVAENPALKRHHHEALLADKNMRVRNHTAMGNAVPHDLLKNFYDKHKDEMALHYRSNLERRIKNGN